MHAQQLDVNGVATKLIEPAVVFALVFCCALSGTKLGQSRSGKDAGHAAQLLPVSLHGIKQPNLMDAAVYCKNRRDKW